MTKSHEFLKLRTKGLNPHVIIVSCIGLVLIASGFFLNASTLYSIKVSNQSSSYMDLYQDGKHVLGLKSGQKWACFVKEGKSTKLEAKYYLNNVLRTLSDTFEGTNNWTWTIKDSGSEKEKK